MPEFMAFEIRNINIISYAIKEKSAFGRGSWNPCETHWVSVRAGGTPPFREDSNNTLI